MTGLNFAGGSEFAAVELWTSPPHIALIVAITALVNSRHLLMGASLAPLLQHLPRRRVLPALFFMCDESWAMGVADARRRALGFSLAYYLGVSAGLYTVWVACTALGAIIGPLLGDIHAYGFDMAFPAVFLVLLRGMWQGMKAARPWLVSLVVCRHYLLVPGAWYVASGALAGLAPPGCWRRTQHDLQWPDPLDLGTDHRADGAATYLTRIVGFLALRNRTLSKRAVTVMEAAPGCVLISVIAPDFVADKPADLAALAITLLAPRGCRCSRPC